MSAVKLLEDLTSFVRTEVSMEPLGLLYDGRVIPDHAASKAQVEEWCTEWLEGEFKVMYAREDKWTDKIVFFAIYCESHEDADTVGDFFSL